MQIPDPSDATQVRRCARCTLPTLFCVRAWHHRFAGIDTPSRTLELRCASCGAEVTLHPHTKIAAERLIAILMIPAVFPSLYFFASARRKARAWNDNPVVGGHHHPVGPPDRWCSCGCAASCVRLRQQRVNGIPVGTRSDYRCGACSRTFTVPDVAHLVFLFVISSLVFAAGALVIAFPPGQAVGAEASNRWFGVGLVVVGALGWVMVGLGIRARMIHPERGGD